MAKEYTLEEIQAMGKPKGKSKEYTLEEIQSMGNVGQTVPTDTLSERMVGGVGDVLSGAYELSQIPVKTAMSAMSPTHTAGEFLSDVGQRGREAITDAPTGQEVLEEYGVSGEPILPKKITMPFYPNEVEVPDMVNPSPSGIGGVLIEAPFDPLTYIGPTKGASVAKGVLSKQAAKAEAKGFKSTVEAVKKLMKKSNVVSEGMDPETIGRTLFQEDMVQFLDDPKKLKAFLEGSKIVDEKKAFSSTGTVKSFKGTNLKDNPIAAMNADNIALIREAKLQFPGAKVSRGNIAMRVIETLRSNKSLSSLEDAGPNVYNRVIKELNNRLLKGNPTDKLDIEQLYELKKSANKILNNKDFVKSIGSEGQTTTKEVITQIRQEIDNLVGDMLDKKQIDVNGVSYYDAGEFFKVNNNRMKNLINMKDILAGVDIGKYDKPTLKRLLLSFTPIAVAGGAIGVKSGMGGLAGAAGGVGIQAAAKMQRALAKPKPESAAQFYKGAQKMYLGAEKMAVPAGAIAPQMMREGRMNNSRSPDSVGMPQQVDPRELAEQANFLFSDTEVPRDTEWVKSHPKLFLARLGQANPQLAQQMKIALAKGNDTVLKKTLPLIAQQVPEIFEFDEYGSFDGKIVDPNMRQMYSEKVMSDDSLDTYEKAEMLDHLNRTNEVLQ